MGEKFSLKWSNFQANASNLFRKLRITEDFYDVTLVSDDHKQVSAHKIVLCASSEYFKNILKNNKHSHPLLCLNDVDSNELNNVLDYIYNGELQIHQDHLDQFLQVAHRFQLEGLAQQDYANMTESKTSNWLDFLDNEKDDDAIILEESEYNEESDQKALSDFEKPPKDRSVAPIQPSSFDIVEELDQKIQEKFARQSDEKLERDDDAVMLEDSEYNEPEEETMSGLVKPPKDRQVDVKPSSFENVEELDQKIEEKIGRQDDGKFVCKPCGKLFKVKQHAKEHTEIHFVGLSFPCPHCESRLRTRTSLRMHVCKYHKNIHYAMKCRDGT